MSKQFLYVLCTINCFFTTYTSDLYTPYAKQWFNRYIQDAQGILLVSVQDADLIKRLVESSLRRAQATLQAQEVMLQAMRVMWQSGQNIAQTRLNPTKVFPYEIKDEQKKVVTQDFWSQLELYEAACKDYCLKAEQIVHGNALEGQLAKDAVADMRKQVRVCMIDALSDVKKQLEALHTLMLKNVGKDEAAQLAEAFKKQFSISSFLTDYIPNLVMHQFIKADAFYTKLSQDSWFVLEKMQAIGNQAWHAIETSRASFYQALLNEINLIYI